MRFRTPYLPVAEITPEGLYRGRREFIRTVAGVAAGALAWPAMADAQSPTRLPVAGARKSSVGGTNEPLTPFDDATTYNNYYELSRKKDEPVNLAHTLRPAPWTVSIEGEVARPARYPLEDLIKPGDLEERVYRHRCVEGWSMVIPWIGIPLGTVIGRLAPTTTARYVEFTTLNDPAQLPGLADASILPWPYVEALRLDEARHPLSLLAVGMYGKVLPNQNGAPLRLVVPWKYGFKGAKSIVRIRFTAEPPRTAWNVKKPHEYGFYANVNPTVDHPRWSQARERRIGELFKRPTLMFNGYADQVAALYSGLDLTTNF